MNEENHMVLPHADDGAISVDECNIHGQYDGTKCPHCARVLVLKQTAILGLENQYFLLNTGEPTNPDELQKDILRALNFLRLNT